MVNALGALSCVNSFLCLAASSSGGARVAVLAEALCRHYVGDEGALAQASNEQLDAALQLGVCAPVGVEFSCGGHQRRVRPRLWASSAWVMPRSRRACWIASPTSAGALSCAVRFAIGPPLYKHSDTELVSEYPDDGQLHAKLATPCARSSPGTRAWVSAMSPRFCVPWVYSIW